MKKSEGCKQKNSTGRWKKTEHERFMKALEKYGKNWVQIQRKVPSRTLTQVRSHAQKILQSMPEEERKLIEMDESERKGTFCKERKQSVSTDSLQKGSEKFQQIDKKEEDIRIQDNFGVEAWKKFEQNKEIAMNETKIMSPLHNEFPGMNDSSIMFSPTTLKLEHFLYAQYYSQNLNIMPIQIPYFIVYQGDGQHYFTQEQNQ